MLDTSARLLRLLSLFQVRRDWTGAELAERLDITPRTVRRDIEKLRSIGYPVTATPGATGGYRLEAGSQVPPLLLDDDEVVAVAVALRTVALGSVEDIEESALRALSKLDQVMPARLRHRLTAMEASVVVVPSGASSVDAGLVAQVAAASRDHVGVRFDYRAHDGTSSARAVEPYRLIAVGPRWYLLGYDTDRSDWRTFRLDRMVLRVPGGPRFAPRELPADDVADWTRRGVTQRVYTYTARFTVHAAAEVVADLVSTTKGVVRPLTADTCSFVTGSDSLDALAVHVAGIGFEVDVHEPPELVDHIAQVAARLARTAARQDGADAAADLPPECTGQARPAAGDDGPL